MPSVSSGPLVLLQSFLWLVVWIFAFHGAGTLVMRGALRRDTAAETALYKVFSVSAGLFVYSTAFFVCALAGRLTRASVLALLAAGLIPFVIDKMRYWTAERRMVEACWAGAGFWGRAAMFAFAAVAAASFAASTLPPTGNDALAYHLYLPRLYAEHGSLWHEPTYTRSVWPSAMGLLYAAGLLVQGAALAQGFGWLTAILAAVSVPVIALRFGGASAARWSGAFFASIPLIWMQSFLAYTDNAVALYCLLSFAALWIWTERAFEPRWGVVAGLCLAALVSVKLYALLPAAILIALFVPLWIASRANAARKLAGIAVAAAAASTLCGAWFVRSWVYTGNPVYPFLGKVFGGNGFTQRFEGYSETARGVLDAVSVPWNLAMNPDLFGGEPLGAALLAALPVLIFIRRASAPIRLAAWFCLIFVPFWYFLIEHSRFLFPILPFLSLALGTLVASETARHRVARLALGAVLCVQAALCLYYPARLAPAALGSAPAEAFLARHERSYGFLKETASALEGQAPGKILFIGEARMFYAPAEAVWYGPSLVIYCRKKGLAMDSCLKNDLGVTHAITRSTDPASKRLPQAETKYGALPPADEVFSRGADDDGRKNLYTLWRFR